VLDRHRDVEHLREGEVHSLLATQRTLNSAIFRTGRTSGDGEASRRPSATISQADRWATLCFEAVSTRVDTVRYRCEPREHDGQFWIAMEIVQQRMDARAAPHRSAAVERPRPVTRPALAR
jgi:hypothetical protein